MSQTTADPAEMRAYSDIEYVFEPHDNSLPAARKYIQDVWDRRAFIVLNARSAHASSQQGTRLGSLWSILDPLFQAMIFWFLFATIRGGGDGRFLMVVSGIFLYTFVSSCVGQGGRSVLQSKGLVLNSTFPLATLPLSSIYTALLALGPMAIIYGLAHLLFGGAITPMLLILPFLFLLTLAISTGLTLIAAVLVVYIRDMSNMLDYILRIMMFTTPILYRHEDLAAIPGVIQYMLLINPLFTLFSSFQAVLGGHAPQLSWMVQSITWAIVLPLVGFRLFTSRERGFALRL